MCLKKKLRDFREKLCNFKRGCVMYERLQNMRVCNFRDEDMRLQERLRDLGEKL